MKHLLPSLLFGLLTWSCANKQTPNTDAPVVLIDGSSTVYPITADIVDLFKSESSALNFSLKVSGTSGGFEKFAKGQVHINNASRAITPEEDSLCERMSVDFLELQVAYDGIAVVVNRSNDWVDHLTVSELSQIWGSDRAVHWSDIRDGWPETAIKPYGPGEASGTFDYFKEAILGHQSIRNDYTKSENDNLLARAVGAEQAAIGFFGLGYFKEYSSELRLVPISDQNDPVLPDASTISTGAYSPLSRVMYLYVNEDLIQSEAGQAFVRFYMENAASAAKKAGYVPLPHASYQQILTNL